VATEEETKFDLEDKEGRQPPEAGGFEKMGPLLEPPERH
jgi:hypothetical protein